MKRPLCALLVLLPLTALAATYPIEVEKQLNGANVSMTALPIDYNLAALDLHNYGQRPTKCVAIFRNGPDVPRTRQTTLAAGERATLTGKFSNSVIRLRVKVTCELLD